MNLNLFTKISLMILFVLIFALVLNGFLNFFNYKNSYSKILNSKLSVIAGSVKSSLEEELDLGISLSNITSAQNTLDEIIKKENQLKFLKVIGSSSEVLFDTNPDNIGTSTPIKWLENIIVQEKESKDWIPITVDNSIVLGFPIVNSFDVVVGALFLGYSKEEFDSEVFKMLYELGEGVLILLAFVTLITFIGVYVLLKKLRNSFSTMRQILENTNENIEIKQNDILLNYVSDFNDKRIEVVEDIEEIKEIIEEKRENKDGNQ